MRNTIKTLILFIATIAAIGGVLFYAKTKVEIPKTPPAYNQFKYYIYKNIKILTEKEEEQKTDSIFTIVKDRITIFELEGKITMKEKDESLNEFISVYAPLFAKQSFSKFDKSDWSENNHPKMSSRVIELKAFKLSNNQQVLSSSKIDSLNQINKIINDYNHAWTVANNTKFSTVANARNLKENANKYINNKYLSNCISLNTSLKNLMGKVGESHRDQLNDRINQLSIYNSSSQTYYFNTLVPNFDQLFKDYKESANSLYGGDFGTKTETNTLFAKAARLMEDAVVYYSLN